MAEKNNAPEVQQDLSEILRVRREKLSTLQGEGRDPFQQTKFAVSRRAQEIKDNFEARVVWDLRGAGPVCRRLLHYYPYLCSAGRGNQFPLCAAQ